MIFFRRIFLDREKDIAVDLSMEGDRLFYVIRTPNHHSGNLILNLARICSLSACDDENGLKVIRGEIPAYYDGENRMVYIFRLGNTKIANIYPDGTVEMRASVPAISKTLMSQTKDYKLGIEKTIVKTFIRSECKFRTDLHTHMNGNLPPDVLIALGICHQIRYPYYYVKKLSLRCTKEQIEALETQRKQTELSISDSPLTGRSRERRIDDLTYINFAELILADPVNAAYNIRAVRNSLTIPKDGQAVFADLEKVYLYRYVFTKGTASNDPVAGINTAMIPDEDVRACVDRILADRRDSRYRANTLYQDLLLWIAREYRAHGVVYAEITDTALLDRAAFPSRLRQIHEIMPSVTRETGVTLRFLGGIRRTPLTIVRDRIAPNDYLVENLRCLRVIAEDPYLAGCDIIGEEVNDINELRGLFRELVKLSGETEGFVIRIHAGENDSLRDNVSNSIRCVADSLDEGMSFPTVRIGHGLYTCDLNSARGKELLSLMRKAGVTLEFQITSNVRLNNLSHLDRHPLRQYLEAGIDCVQGTDGGALYGTNSIDEELSLEKLLGLSTEELCRMRRSEDRILTNSMLIFSDKTASFYARLGDGDVERYYDRKLAAADSLSQQLLKVNSKLDTASVLKDRLTVFPKNMLPVIVAGGSFNNSRHRTSVREEDLKLIDELLDHADPARVCFVIGPSLCAQEGYLAKKAAGRFPVYAIVPTMITPQMKKKLLEADVRPVLSVEGAVMSLYKSYSYEIFKRMPSVLLAFDGNSPALNLIQEARNGREKCRIYINPRSRGLSRKARMLEGYVHPLSDKNELFSFIPAANPPEDREETTV